MSDKPISRRDMLKLSGTLLAGTVLAGCAPKAAPTAAPQEPTAVPVVQEPTKAPPKKVEGNVVIFFDRKEFTEEQETKFEADHPGITVEFVERAEPARLYAMIAAGTPPDLIRVQAPSIPGYLARDMLHDLTPYFESSTVLKMDDLMPANNYYKAESPLKIGTGKIYGMCKDFSPDFTIFAAKKPFADAGVPLPDPAKPLTYAEVVDLAKKVGKKEGERVTMWGYGYDDAWIDRIWMNCLAELDQSLYSEDFSKINITSSEETKKLTQYYYDLAKENISANALNPSPNGWAGGDFTAGLLAMMQYGFWYTGWIVSNNDTLKSEAVMLPAATWAGKRRDPTMTATGTVMEAEAKNPDAAWVLFEYYNAGEPATTRAKSGWGVPALKSMMNLIPQENDFQKQCYKILQEELALNTTPLQFNPYLGEEDVSTTWKKYLEQALRGDITYEDLLKNFEAEVNGLITEGKAKISG